MGEAARERVRVSVQRARALIGSYNPLNRLLREVFHVLLQLPCVAGAILTNVHRDPQRDVVALREVRRGVKKFVMTNDVGEKFHPIDASVTLIEFSEPVREFRWLSRQPANGTVTATEM